MFTAFYAVIFSLYAVLCLLCPVANSLYAVLFSLCTELKSLYAVLSSCRAFSSLYAVPFLNYVRWLTHYTRCFSCYIHGTSFSLDLKRGHLCKEVKMAASMDKLDSMVSMAHILKKNNLGHLTELFHREKITPDIISMLSTHDMNQLGITSRADMMNLRLQCCTYGRQKPENNRVGCGAPEFDIPKSVLEDHLEEGFTIEEISCMLSVSDRKI